MVMASPLWRHRVTWHHW